MGVRLIKWPVSCAKNFMYCKFLYNCEHLFSFSPKKVIHLNYKTSNSNGVRTGDLYMKSPINFVWPNIVFLFLSFLYFFIFLLSTIQNNYLLFMSPRYKRIAWNKVWTLQSHYSPCSSNPNGIDLNGFALGYTHLNVISIILRRRWQVNKGNYIPMALGSYFQHRKKK